MTESERGEGSTGTGDVRISINPLSCTGCGLCAEVCPFGLPERNNNGKYEIRSPESCIECSACQRNCPANAIIMKEQVGCGCLWDAKQRHKAKNKGETSCCGCITPKESDELEIKVLDAFNVFVKPNLGTCCVPPPDENKSNKNNEK